MSRYPRTQMEGNVYGGWLIIFELNQQICSAQCICGEVKLVFRSNILQRKSLSCGCLISEKLRQARTTHGISNSPTWLSWSAMWQRCTNSKRDGWKYYGGKGVTIDKRWKSFENFLSDMGIRPESKELGRRHSAGPYCKNNCVWQTHEENMNNRDH